MSFWMDHEFWTMSSVCIILTTHACWRSSVDLLLSLNFFAVAFGVRAIACESRSVVLARWQCPRTDSRHSHHDRKKHYCICSSSKIQWMIRWMIIGRTIRRMNRRNISTRLTTFEAMIRIFRPIFRLTSVICKRAGCKPILSMPWWMP